MFNLKRSPYFEEDNGLNIGGASEAIIDESNSEVVTEDTETVTDEVDGGKDTDNSQTDVKPVQNHETNEQFKAARIEAERKAQARQDNFAKSRGFNNFDEMESYAKQQDLVDKGYSPEEAQRIQRLEDMEQRAMARENNSRIIEEKTSLKDVKYFKDLEPLIDATLKVNPNLSVKDVFVFIKGQKMDELLSKETKSAAQRTLNNLNSKAHIKPDGGGTDIETTTIDDDEWKQVLTLMPGTKKEDYIKFKKSQK